MQPTNNRREHHGVHSGHKAVPPAPAHSHPTGAWRQKFDCKVNKGDHTFVLAKPNQLYRKQSLLGVEEYYNKEEMEYAECVMKNEPLGKKWACWRTLYHFKCTACGKQHMSSKRIP
jgi:hypothetical protein